MGYVPNYDEARMGEMPALSYDAYRCISRNADQRWQGRITPTRLEIKRGTIYQTAPLVERWLGGKLYEVPAFVVRVPSCSLLAIFSAKIIIERKKDNMGRRSDSNRDPIDFILSFLNFLSCFILDNK